MSNLMISGTQYVDLVFGWLHRWVLYEEGLL